MLMMKNEDNKKLRTAKEKKRDNLNDNEKEQRK